jgi:uncharacterized DUF497 family protein
MSCEWDEHKRASNRRKHAVDFAVACRIFDGATIEAEDPRGADELRIGAFGQVAGEILFVVYTWRGERRRLISARRATRSERRKFIAALRREGWA